jgi:hypothetical protein
MTFVLNSSGLVVRDNYVRGSQEDPPSSPWVEENGGDWRLGTGATHGFSHDLHRNTLNTTDTFVTNQTAVGGKMFVQGYTARGQFNHFVLARFDYNSGSPNGYGIKTDEDSNDVQINEWTGGTKTTLAGPTSDGGMNNEDNIWLQLYVEDDVQEGGYYNEATTNIVRLSGTDASNNSQNSRYGGVAASRFSFSGDTAEFHDVFLHCTDKLVVIDDLPTGWKAKIGTGTGESDFVEYDSGTESAGVVSLDCSIYGNGSSGASSGVPYDGLLLAITNASDVWQRFTTGVFPGDDYSWVLDGAATALGSVNILVPTSIRRDSSGLVFEDDFNRANSSTIGNNWVEHVGDWEISSNRLQESTTGAEVPFIEQTGPDDRSEFFLQCILYSPNWNDDRVCPMIWFQGTSDANEEGWGALLGSGTDVRLFQFDDGSTTQLDSDSAPTLTNSEDAEYQIYGKTNLQEASVRQTGKTWTVEATDPKPSGWAGGGKIGFRLDTTGATIVNVVDDVIWCETKDVTVASLPTGWKAKILNASQSVVAEATESGGTATIDCTQYREIISSTGASEKVPIGGWAALIITDASDVEHDRYDHNGIYPGDEFTWLIGETTEAASLRTALPSEVTDDASVNISTSVASEVNETASIRLFVAGEVASPASLNVGFASEVVDSSSVRLALQGEGTGPASLLVSPQSEVTELASANITFPQGEIIGDASGRVALPSEVSDDGSANISPHSEVTDDATLRTAFGGEITDAASAWFGLGSEATGLASERVTVSSEVADIASVRLEILSRVVSTASLRTGFGGEVTDDASLLAAFHGEVTDAAAVRIAVLGRVAGPASLNVGFLSELTADTSTQINQFGTEVQTGSARFTTSGERIDVGSVRFGQNGWQLFDAAIFIEFHTELTFPVGFRLAHKGGSSSPASSRVAQPAELVSLASLNATHRAEITTQGSARYIPGSFVGADAAANIMLREGVDRLGSMLVNLKGGINAAASARTILTGLESASASSKMSQMDEILGPSSLFIGRLGEQMTPATTQTEVRGEELASGSMAIRVGDPTKLGATLDLGPALDSTPDLSPALGADAELGLFARP